MDDKQAKRLGKLLRDQRAKLGLSVRQLEARCGVSFPTINRLEQGQFSSPAPDKLAAVARALRLSLADVYTLADYAVPNDLPSPTLYLRTKYRDLPTRELAALSRDIERVFKKRGINPNAGPLSGEDESLDDRPKLRKPKSPRSKKGGRR